MTKHYAAQLATSAEPVPVPGRRRLIVSASMTIIVMLGISATVIIAALQLR